MRFISYLKERMYQLLILAFLVLTIETLLFTVRGGWLIQIYVFLVLNFGYFIVTGFEYWKERKYFKETEQFLEALDKKYLISEMLPAGGRMEQRKFRDILKETGKSMADHVNYYKVADREYKDYIEMWIHEVKIPIATAKLIVENNRNDVTESMEEELSKIEEYTEQALFYARSSYVEKDYMIKKTNLKEVVSQVVIKNKKNLIHKHTVMNLHDLDAEVLSDSKWLNFIISQIFANSIKYCDKERLSLEIYAEVKPEKTELFIRDNGVGMREEEQEKAFQKGFTGTNGRRNHSKSTGIGLYLCKKLCTKLKHGIELSSVEGEGCTVKIVFPKNSFTEVINE